MLMSPLHVYRAADRSVRWQFWGTVGVLVATTSARLFAQATSPSSVDEWLAPHNLFAIAGIVYGVGMLVAELYTVRKRLEAAEKTYARVDVIDLHFAAIRSELAALRRVVEDDETGQRLDAFAARFEAFLQTVNTWTNTMEHKLHTTREDLVRLEARK